LCNSGVVRGIVSVSDTQRTWHAAGVRVGCPCLHS